MSGNADSGDEPPPRDEDRERRDPNPRPRTRENTPRREHKHESLLTHPALLPAIASIIILGTFALVVAQFIQSGTIKNSTARLFLAAGILLLGGKEAIRAVIEKIS